MVKLSPFTAIFTSADKLTLYNDQVNLRVISYIKMKVCVCVCVYVRRPAAGPTQAITPKFGVGSSFHPGSAPSQGATQNVGPRGYLPY